MVAFLVFVVELSSTTFGGISSASSKALVQVFDTLNVGFFNVFVLLIDTVVVELVISDVLGDRLFHHTS